MSGSMNDTGNTPGFVSANDEMAGDTNETHPIYDDILHHPIYGPMVKNSTRGTFVYCHLKSILSGQKGQRMRQPFYAIPSDMVFIMQNPLDAAYFMVNQGYSPLVMAPFQDKELVAKALWNRTSAPYQFRSHKYKDITTKFRRPKAPQCLCTFMPNVLIYRDKSLQTLEYNECRPVHVGLVSSLDTMEGEVPDEARYVVIRSKLCCLFDMAIHQRAKYKTQLDSLIVTDLGCQTPEDCLYFARALTELYASYALQFRRVMVAIDSTTMLASILQEAFPNIPSFQPIDDIDISEDNNEPAMTMSETKNSSPVPTQSENTHTPTSDDSEEKEDVVESDTKTEQTGSGMCKLNFVFSS